MLIDELGLEGLTVATEYIPVDKQLVMVSKCHLTEDGNLIPVSHTTVTDCKTPLDFVTAKTQEGWTFELLPIEGVAFHDGTAGFEPSDEYRFFRATPPGVQLVDTPDNYIMVWSVTRTLYQDMDSFSVNHTGVEYF